MNIMCKTGMALPLLLGLGAPVMAQDAAKPDAAKAAPPFTIVQMLRDTVAAADGTYVETLHIQMRANNQAAAPQIGQMSIPYDMASQDVTVVDAHTLKADGKTIPVEASAIYEKLPQGQDGQEVTSERSKVIVFPQVTGGDSVVYTIRISDHQPYFPGQFQTGQTLSRTMAVEDWRETITLPKSLPLTVETHDMAFSKKQDGDNWIYSWQYTQPDPISEEPQTYTPLAHAPRFFASTFKDYAAMGRAYAVMTEAKRVVTPNVQALADQLTQGAADRREQARKLYEWVSGHIRYVAIELGQGSLVPHDVDAILANGYGDCKDHDVLLQSLLKAKGIVSQSVLINGSASYEMPDVPSLATLNHVITYIPEFKLYLDSTAQVAPFGVLPMNEYGKPIVSVSDKEAALGKMALLAPGAAKRSFKTDVVLDKSGALTGTSTTTASGGYDVTLRGIALGIQAAGPVAAASSVLTRLGYKNGEGSFSMAPPQVMTPDYSITGTFTAQGWADEASGKSRFFLPGGLRLFGLTGDGPMGLLNPGRLKDDEPVPCFNAEQSEDLSLKIPAGMKFGIVPKDQKIEAPGLLFTAHWTLDGDTLRVHREFSSRTDTLFCSGEARKKDAAALKEISESYDGNLWLEPASAAADSPAKPADKAAGAVAMAAPVLADPANDLLKTATAAYTAGDFTKAVADFQAYLALRPDNSQIWYLQGAAHNRLGQRDLAEADFAQAVKLKPDNSAAWQYRGANLQQMGQSDKALAAYDEMVKLKPQDAASWKNRGLQNNLMLRFDEAVADFTKAAELNPQDSAAFYYRGLAHDNLNQRDTALLDFSQAIKLQPDYALALESRGNDYSTLGRYSNAIADLSEAIKLNPDEPRILYNRGGAYLRHKDYALAIADYSRALALKPDYSIAWHNRGIAYNDSGQWALAVADYGKALALKPDDPAYLNDRAVSYRRMGQTDSAITDLDRAIALKADYALALFNRGWTYSDRKQYDRALADLNQSLKLNDKFVLGYVQRGFVQLQLQDYPDAIADESQALKLNPGNGQALVNRANAYLASGDAAHAVSDCDNAIALKPDFADAYAVRGLAKRKLGQMADADADSGKAASLAPTRSAIP